MGCKINNRCIALLRSRSNNTIYASCLNEIQEYGFGYKVEPNYIDCISVDKIRYIGLQAAFVLRSFNITSGSTKRAIKLFNLRGWSLSDRQILHSEIFNRRHMI